MYFPIIAGIVYFIWQVQTKADYLPTYLWLQCLKENKDVLNDNCNLFKVLWYQQSGYTKIFDYLQWFIQQKKKKLHKYIDQSKFYSHIHFPIKKSEKWKKKKKCLTHKIFIAHFSKSENQNQSCKTDWAIHVITKPKLINTWWNIRQWT